MKIGNVEFFTWNEYRNGKNIKHYENAPDCENCPYSWESISYEGECEACGCYFSDQDFNTPTWVCLLPNMVKQLIKKLKGWNE